MMTLLVYMYNRAANKLTQIVSKIIFITIDTTEVQSCSYKLYYKRSARKLSTNKEEIETICIAASHNHLLFIQNEVIPRYYLYYLRRNIFDTKHSLVVTHNIMSIFI